MFVNQFFLERGIEIAKVLAGLDAIFFLNEENGTFSEERVNEFRRQVHDQLVRRQLVGNVSLSPNSTMKTLNLSLQTFYSYFGSVHHFPPPQN